MKSCGMGPRSSSLRTFIYVVCRDDRCMTRERPPCVSLQGCSSGRAYSTAVRSPCLYRCESKISFAPCAARVCTRRTTVLQVGDLSISLLLDTRHRELCTNSVCRQGLTPRSPHGAYNASVRPASQRVNYTVDVCSVSSAEASHSASSDSRTTARWRECDIATTLPSMDLDEIFNICPPPYCHDMCQATHLEVILIY